MSAPLVSVILPAYSRARYVGEAIESIQEQTFTDWELIAVDDGSTDATLGTMEQFARETPRIRVHANEENLGACKTYNIAIGYARGDLIAIQDSDDISYPDRLETSVRAFRHYPELGAFSGLFTPIDDRGNRISIRRPYRVAHSAAVFRASALQAVDLYDEAFPVGFDVDLYLRLCAAGYSFGRGDPTGARSPANGHDGLVEGRLPNDE